MITLDITVYLTVTWFKKTLSCTAFYGLHCVNRCQENITYGVQINTPKKIGSPLRGSWTMLRIVIILVNPPLSKKLDPPLYRVAVMVVLFLRWQILRGAQPAHTPPPPLRTHPWRLKLWGNYICYSSICFLCLLARLCFRNSAPFFVFYGVIDQPLVSVTPTPPPFPVCYLPIHVWISLTLSWLWGFHIYTPGPVRRVKTDILGIFGRCPAGYRKDPTGAGTVFEAVRAPWCWVGCLPILPAFLSDR